MDTQERYRDSTDQVLPLPPGTIGPEAGSGPAEALWAVGGDGRGRRWHVLHVKSRQEKMLSQDLTAMGIWHYLPLVSQLRHYGKRQVVVERPLFPCYVFLKGSLDEAYQADRTKRVARVIPVADQEQIDWELRNLRLALSSRTPLGPYPFLRKGIRVEVRAGPLRGLQGVIEGWAKADRLILQVEILGRAASLEIDGALLDPVG
ncbi:MAG TPA: transcription termination/antitermination NusG family protein [Tepidisphaeraceae bacterium]|nr:transcription termination/antitermination NusG family protein [Tepidisphaeraceae bacterium]